MWSRRQLLGAGAAAAVLPFAGRPARAATAADRKFLFVFAQGGWDPAWFFAPAFDSDIVDMPDGSQPGRVGGIPFVEHEWVPSARAFLESHGPRTCLVNGFEVRAVAHDVCRRLAMTNSAVQGHDDWAAVLAGRAQQDLLMPALHLSGPSFTDQFSASVVRIGTNGQLCSLLDGSILQASDQLLHAPSAGASALEEAATAARADAFGALSARGRAARIAEIVGATAPRLAELEGYADQLALDAGDALVDLLESSLRVFSAGLSRCAMVAYESWDGVFNGWDTHEQNSLQANHYEELFAALHATMNRAGELPGAAGGTLADELVVVVLSEMGRTPRFNDRGGKDHWTFTSALLAGAGIAGDQVIGAYDDSLLGRPVDLASGASADGGENLLPGHVGATLLALGDVDPDEFVQGAAPIQAVLA